MLRFASTYFLLMTMAMSAANAQLLPPRDELPVTENEAKEAVEAILGFRPESIDMSMVRKVKAREADSIIKIDLESEPYLSESNICRKRILRLSRPNWIGKAELQNDTRWYRIEIFGAEKPIKATDCATVENWILMSPNIEIPDSAIRFLAELRNWINTVTENDFCAAMADNKDTCLASLTILQRHADLKNLRYIELYSPPTGYGLFGAIEFHIRSSDLDTMVLTLFGTADPNPFSKFSISWLII